jgi:Txe/YoeB family toxin of Txe-Axe toxin-antitoxin module
LKINKRLRTCGKKYLPPEKSNKDFQKHKKSANKSILNKINVIYNELKEHPFTGTGKPEPLKELLGYKNCMIHVDYKICIR